MPTTAKKVTVRKSAAKKAPGKKVAPKTTAKKAPKKTAPKVAWVRQSTVAYDPEIGASRFTTQTQRRLLREIVAAKGTIKTEGAKPATLRSIERLADLKLVTSVKGTVKITAAGRGIVA